MMGAAVLIPTLALLLPNDTQRCVDFDEGRTDTGWVTGDIGCCSADACPRDLRRFAVCVLEQAGLDYLRKMSVMS
jgi:hypothetical protein